MYARLRIVLLVTAHLVCGFDAATLLAAEPGLIGWWKLAGDTNDASGAGRGSSRFPPGTPCDWASDAAGGCGPGVRAPPHRDTGATICVRSAARYRSAGRQRRRSRIRGDHLAGSDDTGGDAKGSHRQAQRGRECRDQEAGCHKAVDRTRRGTAVDDARRVRQVPARRHCQMGRRRQENRRQAAIELLRCRKSTSG